MTCKQNASYQLLRAIKKLDTKRQKKPGKTNEEISVCVKAEWVQLHDSYMMMMMMMMMMTMMTMPFLFSENHAIYEMLKNIVQPDWPQTTTWCMHTACWIPKSMNTQSECAILNAFRLQQWLHECASVLHYIHTACFILW